MNLMKSFNRNYMIQNLKKSKSILAFFLGIIPIISLLSFLVFTNTTSYENISLETISIVHYAFVYFIPIILSFCLFGFVYKKKSVDFTLSMPVSKKTIFLTNTITGILLLVLTVVFSAIGIYIASTFMNILLPFRMIVDYILVWSTTYIFVFILSNIAMSVSGNISTQVIVTLLLLFLIPFTLDYISSLSERTYFQPNSYYICLEGMNIDYYSKCYYSDNHALTSFTIPYNSIRILAGGVNYQLWNIVSIIKMMILSVVGYFIGKHLFLKRKMEVNETSFQNLKTHNIIKALTIFPIIVVIKKLTPDPVPANDINYLPILVALIFLLIYSFIYDLITRKSISQVKVCLKHFVITVISVCVFCMICENVITDSSTKHIYAQDKDITEYQISLSDYFTEFSYVTVDEPEIVSYITNLLKKTTNPSYASKELRMKINGKLYTIDAYFGQEQYQKLMTKIQDVMKKKTYDGIVNTNKVFALGFKHWELTKNTNNSKIIKEAKEAVKTGKKCDERYQFSIDTNLYAYQNGRIISYPVKSCTSEVLDDYVVSTLQKENERLYQEIGRNGYHETWQLGFNVTLHHYPESYPCINCKRYSQQKEEELFQLIKKYKNDTFTSKKDYISLTVWYNGVNYVYHTNRIDEFMKVFNKEEDSNDIN